MSVNTSRTKTQCLELTVEPRRLIGQLHQLLIQVSDASSSVPPPLSPHMGQLVPVPRVGHDELEVRLQVEAALEGLVVRANLRLVVYRQHVVDYAVVLENYGKDLNLGNR